MNPIATRTPFYNLSFIQTIFSDWSKIKSKEVDWLPTGREGVTSDQNENTLILFHHKETMWRRLASSHLKTLATASASASTSVRSTQFLLLNRSPSASVFNRYLSAGSVDGAVKKRVEDVMPIATGHEREELEAELEGKKLLDIDFPEGPFGTKEEPSVIKSYYDKRIVGCPGGEGEDEHDVVWFWLEKGKPHECPVCTQHFVLEVVGPGGPPDGHGDDDHHHH